MNREDEIRKRLETGVLPGEDWLAEPHDAPQWAVKGSSLPGDFVAVTSQRNDEARARLIANAPSDLRYLLEKVERLERQINDMATDRLDCGDPMLGAIRSCPFTAITFRYNPDARELSIHASQGANRKAQRELQDRDIAAHRKASAFVAHEIIRTVEEAYAKKEPTDAT